METLKSGYRHSMLEIVNSVIDKRTDNVVSRVVFVEYNEIPI